MTTVSYHMDCGVEDLQVGECTMHRTTDPDGSRYWHMWFRMLREDNGQPFDFVVPMNPNGGYTESGPGGKAWGLTRVGGLMTWWQVSPSINVLNTGEVHPGEHATPSLWHQTPTIQGVPTDAPWITEAP